MSAAPPPPSPPPEYPNSPPTRAPVPWWARGVIALLLVLIVLLAVTLAGLWASMRAVSSVADVLAVKRSDQAVIQVLRSEELAFLVTDRIVTRIDVEMNERSIWAGGRRGFLLATARVYAGVDLKAIKDSDVREEKDVVYVTIPRPSILDISIDSDWRFMDSKTNTWALVDWMTGRDVEAEMRSQLRRRTQEFVLVNKMLPEPQRVLQRLNGYAAVLTNRVGKRVEFRYEK